MLSGMDATGARWLAFVAALALGCGAAAVIVHVRRERPAAAGRAAPIPAPAQAVVQPAVPAPAPPLAAATTPAPPPAGPGAAQASTPAPAGGPDPRALLEQIGRAINAGDAAVVEKLIGAEVLTPAQRDRLRQWLAEPKVRLREGSPVREVGELEIDRLTRWAIELDGAGAQPQQMFFDLRRKDGRWVIEKVALPDRGEGAPRALIADALGIADLFAQAVLRQDFEQARQLVDSTQVSDAKIAALCILFEEGSYQLRAQKPLRKMFERGTIAGFMANVEAIDGSHSAQFGLTLRQTDPAKPWQVAEINLDTMLEDYARRVADGDEYYTPLVPNPQGGDTLVLYFDFDEDELSERTARQLEIVARILRGDTAKKITISGHTDALGTDPYNQRLSERRARTVRDFLVRAGVSSGQIVTVAMGPRQPRRPNMLEDGSDNPLGRRANRRSEIYLDF
jgi:outer membrane protein OmpA-like peptidoglycan-associated protein